MLPLNSQVTVEPNNGEQHPSQATVANQNRLSATVEGMHPKLLMAALRGDVEKLRYFPNEAAAVPPEVAVDLQVNEAPAEAGGEGIDHNWGASHAVSEGDHSATQTNGAPSDAAAEGIIQVAPSVVRISDERVAEDNSAMQVNEAPANAGAEGVDLIVRRVTFDEDTVLHVVATSGDSPEFLASANVIYDKAKNLLHTQNSKGDTPLHCAARAGKIQMVSRLIEFACGEERGEERVVKELLRVENNLNETALHQAVRVGNKDIVSRLMGADSELACFPEDGTSPLYLAISLEHDDIAKLLHSMSDGNLSYSGPNGQNALHAAVLRSKVMTELLLAWKEDLTEQADRNGSTPLHFAASWMSSTLKPVQQANPNQLYQPDYEGLFPIHVGEDMAVVILIKKCPEIAGLRDCKGRTFLHVAIEKGHWKKVAYACRTPSLEWILNMQDNNGNTALHLAVHHRFLHIFCSLLSNKGVRLNLANNNGETPLDLSGSKIPAGFFYAWGHENLIYRALLNCHARLGCLRSDHFEEHYISRLKPEDRVKESEKMRDSTQVLGIGSALIATVTFGSTFALPGGYKADDHNNGGTPTLAGRYIFDAFMMANTIAFICSCLATMNLMYSGMAMVELDYRWGHFNRALFCALNSVTSLVVAFALGAYLVLAPVAHMTAIAICVLVSVVLFSIIYWDGIRSFHVAIALHRRMGNLALRPIASVIMTVTLVVYWPLVIIFGWAAISMKYGHK